jgi:hypothetical protein
MASPLFDRSTLKIKNLCERHHDLDLSVVLDLEDFVPSKVREEMSSVARNMFFARERGSSIILMMGGHVIRAGVQKFIMDLMSRGLINCLVMNGAGVIHDFEFAMIGATTESVARYIKTGEFGLWKETAQLNDIINQAYIKDTSAGMGESVAEAIETGDFEYKNNSILAAAWREKVPVTVHVGVGYDIIHEHPNCDGAALGALSYNDFLKFVAVVQNLEGGVLMNFGSAVMAPEVYLKALSMARNVAHQKGNEIRSFSTLICDLYDLPADYREESPKEMPGYYFRPWKTMLVRTVSEGGEGYYVQGDHRQTIPELWVEVNRMEKEFLKK